MTDATIYHNPRCTKSRETLELLRSREIDVKVVEYLKTPPSREELQGLLKSLQLEPRQLIRKKDFQGLGLPPTEDPQALIELMVQHPRIIERPIVVVGNQARLGRPPENVLELLDE
ncbi:arsenate reductase (glutaredoxin) [Lignipirellula cremea]|uniref:Arsenate reductase n=1 Tax=Lignipirellula cremea TaxID=2528010 RepID=A0A518DYD3_9BACT|nr:arsenate reductase (glutaredoxin) [Lignipirellula cremea]QDU96856.1 Arsenate reductase [Lignipirellula cremea]